VSFARTVERMVGIQSAGQSETDIGAVPRCSISAFVDLLKWWIAAVNDLLIIPT